MPSPPASSTRPRSEPDVWTTRRLLQWMLSFFEDKGIDSPRIVSELLLGHVFDCDRLRLYMEVDRPASPKELATLRDLVGRAAKHEPVQYLVGRWWFYGREFDVDRTTLIPRPCTEMLAEYVVRFVRDTLLDTPVPRLADLGTGTGCIAVTLACELPAARVVATDVVDAALDLAGTNATRHEVDERIEFRAGPLYEALGPSTDDARFDVIVSNPPYIPDHEWDAVAPNVRDHEPATALRAGPDGLDVLRPLIEGAGAWLVPGGLLALEVASSHIDTVVDLVASAGLVDVQSHPDHEGLPRIVTGRRPA